jgi:2',3'-cyclic-nucleotide 2'-phosphodiesterase (5'-nucleotidase family)
MPVRLLHYSDVENACDDPVRMGRLAGTIRSLDGDDAVVVGSGDDTGPGVLAHHHEGRQALPFFRAVGTDLETFGNHDLDLRLDPIREVVADSPQEWVVANLHGGDGERGGEHDDGSDPGAPFAGVDGTTVRERDGRTVGFVGVVDPATPRIAPAASELTVTDPVEAVRTAADEFEEVDHLVVLAHLRAALETDVAAVDGVDAVLGGHVHAERHEVVDGTLVVRRGANGQVVWEVELPAEGPPTATRHETAAGPLDESVADALRERLAEVGLAEVVATVEEPIHRGPDRLTRGESRVGNLVADAYRWAGDADVGFVHAGGLRDGRPLSGAVTAGDVASVNPFGGPLHVLAVDGAQLRTLLEAAFGPDRDDGRVWHGDVSGMTVEYDADAGRLLEVAVDREPVDGGRTYTLATNAYVVHSDDWPVPSAASVEAFGSQLEVAADYAREAGIDVELEGRLRER